MEVPCVRFEGLRLLTPNGRTEAAFVCVESIENLLEKGFEDGGGSCNVAMKETHEIGGRSERSK